MCFRFLIILGFCIFSGFLKAQNIERYFQNFNNFNGLSSNGIQSIYQDKKGFIWLATTDGLVKYDGYHFKTFRYLPNDTFSLSCNNITDLVEIEPNQLLVGTYDCGINIFNTKTEKAKRIRNKQNAEGNVGDNRVLSLFKDKQGTVWIALNDGSLNIFDKFNHCIKTIRFKAIKTDDKLAFCHGFSEHFSNPDYLWVGTSNGLVLLNKKNYNYQIYKYSNQFPNSSLIFNRYRYPLHIDKDNVWMGAWGGGVMHLNLKTNTWESFLLNSEPPLNGGKNVVRCMAIKSKTELWISTGDSGTGIFDINSKKMHFFDVESNGMKGDNKTIKQAGRYVFVDRDQNLWAGYADGLFFHNPRNAIFEKYRLPLPTKTNLKNFNHPFYFLEDTIRKGLWVASFHADGISFYDYHLKKWTTFNLGNSHILPRGMIWQSNGNILLLTANMLLTFNPEKSEYKPIELPDTINIKQYNGYSLLRTSNNHIFIGTANRGIFEFNNDFKFLNHYYNEKNKPNSLLENGPIYDLHEDINGNIWVGLEKGASMLEIKTQQYKHFSYTIGNEHQAFKGNSSFISFNNGNNYMSSIASGILGVNAKNNYNTIKGFTLDNGLMSHIVYGIERANDSILVVYNSNGLQFINIHNNKSSYFSTSNDFPFYTSEWGNMKCIDNNLYIGLYNGFIKTSLSNFKFPNKPKAPTISEITIFDKSYFLSSNQNNVLEFNHLQNYIRLYFTNFDYANTSKLRLNYVIKGLSKDTFITEKGINQIVLTGLAPKQYELLVWVSYPESDSSSAVTTWTITISPPWYLSWWFKISVVILFLSMVYLIYRFRLKQMREKNNLKRQLAEMENTALRAQMNPHFLFNSLNSVNYYIQNNEPQKASQYLKKFSKLVRMILNNSRKDTVTLEDELEALKIYLELEALRFSHHFTYEIEVSANVVMSDIVVPPLLIQPYVENAIWHGIMQKESGGMVKIRIFENKGNYQFVIEDNGIGRKKANEIKSKSALEQKSHGMEITNERIRLFNTTHSQQIDITIFDLEINQEPSGTKISINYKP